MTEIKIAPDLDEIRREGNVFECDFNKMHIKWIVAYDGNKIGISDEASLKKLLQAAIALAGKMWQVAWTPNNNLPFASELYVNDEKVEYPKN